MEIVTQPEADIPIINVAKTAVVRKRDGFVLVLWRGENDDYHPGKPDFPGGEMKPGEKVEDATVREVREEIRIDLERTALRRVRNFTTQETRPFGAVIISREYSVVCVDDAQAEQAEVGDEHDRLDWLPMSKARAVLEAAGSVSKLALMYEVERLAAAGELPIAS